MQKIEKNYFKKLQKNNENKNLETLPIPKENFKKERIKSYLKETQLKWSLIK